MAEREYRTTAATTQGEYIQEPSALMTGVVGPILRIAAGSFGAGLFITIAQGVTMGGDVWHVLTNVPLWPGGVVAGLLLGAGLFVWGFLDLSRELVGTWARNHDHAQQAALKAQIDELQRQNGDLRRRSDVSDRYGVQVAAERMLTDYFERNQKISRASCMARGMTRPDWDAATTALREAGVLNERGDVVATDYASAWAAVLRHFAGSKRYVRTADGDFAQV